MTIQSVCLVDVNGIVQNAIALENDPTSINYSHYTPPAGLTMVIDPLQQAGVGWTYANGIFSPPVPPVPTAQQLAAAAMASGLIITSTSTPELNGTYGLDSNSQQNVIGTVTAILLTGNFPNGQSTMPWIDATGAAHVWPSPAEFKIFATAFSTFVSNVALYAASNGASGSIPSNEVTIP